MLSSRLTFSLNNLDEVESQTPTKGDRFIPERSFKEDGASDYKIASCTSLKDLDATPVDENKRYSKILDENFSNRKRGILKPVEEITFPIGTQTRAIPKAPYKVLDAPLLQDDFYLNLVDWGAADILAVGLGNTAYTWTYSTSQIEKISELEDGNMVTGIGWDQDGKVLGIGTQTGRVQLWDASRKQITASFDDHHERVGAVSIFNSLLLSGSRDRTIKLRDLRAPRNSIVTYRNHKQEVCGLKWSPDGQYFASGGNDNLLYVYSPKTLHPLMRKKHKAAVKAIAWSPKVSGLLASGAGTADKCIRLWNVSDRKLLACRETGSQVCNVLFSKRADELITTHGFSNNEINIWRTNGVNKIHTLMGHTSRVLYLAMSPDGSKIVTGAGDETLRFWDLSYPIDNSKLPVNRVLNFGDSNLTTIR